MATDLILGTAGHIDHGKTALIKALTGTDTDRLPEEKRRGITIELGFAELSLGPYQLGIVDVPGHERFVRNMLAGATGVDLALLVVAADDSVMPQTREHLEILRLLNLRGGVIAITKCDLAESEWLDLIEQDIRELVADTFLADAPIIRTSATEGSGVDELIAALTDAAAQAAETSPSDSGPFRMAIDRTFTVAGHGTVVTGSVISGSVATGDELVIEPDEIKVRVRGLQNHGREAQQVHRGQRAAINLAGVHHDQLRRGHELASPEHLLPSSLLWTRLHLLESAPRPLKNRSRVRLHVGTAEVMASVMLFDRDRLMPGERAPAQLFLSNPAVSTWGQPLVIRSQSPVMTIGGGQVIHPNPSRLRRLGKNDEQAADTLRRLGDLWSDDQLRRASAAAFFAGLAPWQPADLARTAGIDDPAAVRDELVKRGELLAMDVSHSRGVLVHRDALEEFSWRVESVMEKMHAKQPLKPMLDRSRLASHFAYLKTEGLFAAVLRRMAEARKIRLTEREVALTGQEAELSPQQLKLFDWIIEQYEKAAFQPPSVKQLAEEVSRNKAAVPELVDLAVSQGTLVQVSPDIFLHADMEEQMRSKLTERFAAGDLTDGGLTVSQIRETLGTTRKYAVPLCEYLDAQGFTKRKDNVRVLV